MKKENLFVFLLENRYVILEILWEYNRKDIKEVQRLKKHSKNKRHPRITLVSLGVCVGLLCGMISGCDSAEKELPKINLSLWCAEEDHTVLQKMADTFQQKYKAEADINITISEEAETTCRDTVLGNPEEAADVFSFAGDQFGALYRAGALLEVTENANDIIDACGGDSSTTAQSAMVDGKLYAYPATASNGYFMYYNTAYYTEADVLTLDRMLQIAAEHGKKLSMDFTSGWYIYSFFEGAGLSVEMRKDAITNDCNWNAKDTKYTGVQVAQAMLDIASHEGFSNITTEDFQKGVQNGSIIAGISGAWDAKIVEKAWGNRYAATKLPTYTLAGDQVQMHSFAGYKLLGVSAYTKHPEWAMRLAEWITNEENQELRFDERGERPANAKIASSSKVQAAPAMAALQAQSPYGHLQDVADTFWTPTYLFGTVIGAKNPDGTDLQALLDQMVDGITASPKDAAGEVTS